MARPRRAIHVWEEFTEMPAYVCLNDLSTTTLVTALLHEPNWSTQIKLARAIESRTDCYNILRLCEFLLEPQQDRSVQRAVARCVSKHGFAQAFRWMEDCVLNPGNGAERKLLAMRALADFGRPAETAPFFARLCAPDIPAAIRSDALSHLEQTRDPWAPIVLTRLLEYGHPGVAAQVRRARAVWIDRAGGTQAAISQLLNCAVESVGRGNADTAEQALRAALQIAENAPGAEELIYQELRSRIAA